MPATIFPIGILGDGQLAQMTCLAGQKMGIPMYVFASDRRNPAALVADKVWIGDYHDQEALIDFSRSVSVVTYDTESLPMDAVRLAATHTKACPHPDILFMAQNRIREKDFLAQHGYPIARVYTVLSEEDAIAGVEALGLPCVLKTTEQGYDGKGQQLIERVIDAQSAFVALGGVPCILEEWVRFEREMSVIVARNEQGEAAVFPVIDNEHRNHILHTSVAPSTLPIAAQQHAIELAIRMANDLALIGLLTIEMFYTQDGRILINELAPRPHNSGHHTQISAATSQFEQLCRALMGMPLGSTEHRPAVMINLLGDLYLKSHAAVYQHVGFTDGSPLVRTFYYGKMEARQGRKMGHIVAIGDTQMEAKQRALNAYSILQ